MLFTTLHKVFSALCAAGLLLLVAACDGESGIGSGLHQAFSKDTFHSIDITGANYAKDFHLPDTQGRMRSLQDFSGKVVVVFFGFAQCPDVCPTTLAELGQLKQQLGADGKRLQVVFITVDPQRDTAEVLQRYVQVFDPSAVALVPSPQQLAQTAKAFKVFYKKVPGQTPERYTMDHSAGSYVYDPQGRLRLFTRYGSDPQNLLQDVQRLLAES